MLEFVPVRGRPAPPSLSMGVPPGVFDFTDDCILDINEGKINYCWTKLCLLPR